MFSRDMQTLTAMRACVPLVSLSIPIFSLNTLSAILTINPAAMPVSWLTLYSHGFCLLDDHSLLGTKTGTPLLCFFVAATCSRRKISLPAVLLPLVDD